MEKIFVVADHCFSISGENAMPAVNSLPGFATFETNSGLPSFHFVESQEVPQLEKVQYSFRHEGVRITFGSHSGGYLLQMIPDDGEPLFMYTTHDCNVVSLKGNFTTRLYNYALWVGYGLMTLSQKTVAIHSSCAVKDGKAVLFLGESGTGKSTHTGLWRKHIEGTDLLNDDSPIIRVSENEIWVYGSPWSGKTACHKQERHPLAACVRLSQSKENRISRLPILQSYAALHPSCPPTFAYDSKLYDRIGNIIESIITSKPVYHLGCLPDKEAAMLAYRTIFQ